MLKEQSSWLPLLASPGFRVQGKLPLTSLINGEPWVVVVVDESLRTGFRIEGFLFLEAVPAWSFFYKPHVPSLTTLINCNPCVIPKKP